MKALLTGAFQYTEQQIELIKKLGLDIIFQQDEKNINVNIEDIDIVIGNGIFLYNRIEEFEKLKYIQLTSAGIDRVPIDYINENKIILKNARGVYSIPMAEWTICKILEIYKNTKYFIRNQENKIWEKNRNIFELNQKVVTIVGYGNIGEEIAKRLKAFGVHIIAVDKELRELEYISESFTVDNVEQALEKSDIVIATLPLTEETNKFFNKEKFEKMKENSIFINIARGGIVDEEDLIETIKSEKFLAVILDVFQQEPLNQQNELWDLKNVIITPHNSFVSENNNDRMFKVIYENLKEFLKK